MSQFAFGHAPGVAAQPWKSPLFFKQQTLTTPPSMHEPHLLGSLQTCTLHFGIDPRHSTPLLQHTVPGSGLPGGTCWQGASASAPPSTPLAPSFPPSSPVAPLLAPEPLPLPPLDPEPPPEEEEDEEDDASSPTKWRSGTVPQATIPAASEAKRRERTPEI